MAPMILTVCLFGIGILTVTGRLFDDAYEQQIRNQVNESSRFIAQSVEGFMSRAYAVTEELAYSNEILTMEHDTQTPVVQGTAARNDYFELIYIQDMKGDQTARSSGELGNRANRWWFIQMLEKNNPFVSKSYYSVNTDMACASIFFPLIKNNETVGILATDIKLATLQSLVEEFSDVESGRVSFIIDGEGTVVAHPESIYYEELYNYKTLTKTVTQKDSSGKTLYDSVGNIMTEECPIEVSKEYAEMIAAVMSGKTGSAEVTEGGVSYYASYAPVWLEGFSDSWSVITLQNKEQAMALMNRVNRIGIGIAAAAILFSVLLITLIARSITKPIQLSHKRLQLLSEGDLASVVPEAAGHDESAQLLSYLNKTVAALRDMLQEINSFVQTVAGRDYSRIISADFKGEFSVLASSLTEIVSSIGKTLSRINACSNQFLDGLSEFDESARSLADGTTSQASAVEELSSTLAGVSERISRNAENSRNADQMMASVQERLREGNEDLQKLIGDMEAIEADSQEINSITKLMQDIASKTNLLSMNASVEAGRAGEAGKGFAVVAGEIRSLALQCSTAATETSELIQKTRKNVQGGMANLKVTVSSMNAVSEGNSDTSRLLSEISAATREQAEAIGQISTALEQISHITQNNSEAATRSAHTSLQMKKYAQELKTLLTSYRY